MTGCRVPLEIVLHSVVYRRKETVLSDPVQQSGAAEHLPHRILELGKKDLGVGFFRLGNQAPKRIGGRQINSKIGMKIDENGLGRGAAGEQKAHLIAEAKCIGEKQWAIETQDFEAGNGVEGVPDYLIGMLLARHWAKAGERQVAGAPDKPKQREHDGDTQARQYPDGNHSKQRDQSQPELARMKPIEAFEFSDSYHPRNRMDDDGAQYRLRQVVEKRHQRDESDQYHGCRRQR